MGVISIPKRGDDQPTDSNKNFEEVLKEHFVLVSFCTKHENILHKKFLKSSHERSFHSQNSNLAAKVVSDNLSSLQSEKVIIAHVILDKNSSVHDDFIGIEDVINQVLSIILCISGA